jgi:dTDP-4-dehydrorhamnose 3,5-epimerase
LTPILSEKDATAPTLREAEADGLLPTYTACREFYALLTAGPGSHPREPG